MIFLSGDNVLIFVNSAIVVVIVLVFFVFWVVVAFKVAVCLIAYIQKWYHRLLYRSAVQQVDAKPEEPEESQETDTITIERKSISYESIRALVLECDYPSYEELQAHLLSALPPCVRPANMPEKEWNNL